MSLSGEYTINALAKCTGAQLEQLPLEKRILAIREIKVIEPLFAPNEQPDEEEVLLSDLLVSLENHNLNERRRPAGNRGPNIRNYNYGGCFVEYMESLQEQCRARALTKLSAIVTFFTGSKIEDLVALTL